MSTTISSLIFGRPKAQQSPFLLLQSSAAQSALPILRGVIEEQQRYGLVILLCALYAPSDILPNASTTANIHVLDWTSYVPGYQDESDVLDFDARKKAVQDAIKGSTGPLTVALDSVDTLEDDLESPSKAYKFVSDILTSLRSRGAPSRFVCHTTSSSSALPLLRQTSFSSSLIHLTAYPPALLSHIAADYLTIPPLTSSSDPSSPESLKFWRVFIPLSERPRDIESLVYGSNGDGGAGGGPHDDFVVEVLVRSRGIESAMPSMAAIPSARKKGVERAMEGWSTSKGGPIQLEEVESLKSIWQARSATEPEAADPTKNLTFNLSLTDSQQASRSQVPLPYEHDGRTQHKIVTAGQILYDPDSADDLDDEDPDEDLDI